MKASHLTYSSFGAAPALLIFGLVELWVSVLRLCNSRRVCVQLTRSQKATFEKNGVKMHAFGKNVQLVSFCGALTSLCESASPPWRVCSLGTAPYRDVSITSNAHHIGEVVVL